MSFRVINAELSRELLPMAACVEVMKAAMLAASEGSADQPPRLITPLAQARGWLALMPGMSTDLGAYGAKIVGLHPANPAQGLPAIQGFICLFDLETGKPVGLVDGAVTTAIRTAAASALATQYLAREDAVSCGIFGTGVQAMAHVEAMLSVRKLQQCVIWGRDVNKAQALSSQLATRFQLPCHAVSEPEQAAACDIICTVTGSSEPVLKGEWVQPGAHINLVGAHSLTTREADTTLVANAAVYVDSLTSTHNEGGDIMIPLQEGAIEKTHIIGEIGTLLRGACAGRQQASDITLYNSLGITAQDLYAAHYIITQAEKAKVGVVVD